MVDPITLNNFQQANPGVTPNSQDIAIMNGANPSSVPGITPVPNGMIQPASALTLSPQQTTAQFDSAYGMLVGNQAAQTQDASNTANQNVANEEQVNSSLSDLLLGKEQFSQEQAQAQKLPELQKQESDLRSTSLLQTAQFIQGIRNIDQKNVSQGERNTAQIEAQRQNAIDALLTNAQLSFTQGQIQSAQAQVKAAVDLKYNAIEQRIANSDKVLARLDTKASGADAKAVQAAKERNDFLRKQNEEKKASDLQIQQLIMDATPFAPPDVISKAQELFKQGKSNMEVALALGKYGKDYLKNELLKEQLKTEKAQQNNYYASAAKTKAETNVLNNPTGAPLKPLTEGQSKDLTYAQRADQSESQIGRLEATISKMSGAEYLKQKALEGNALTNSRASNDIKQYRQAQRNFVTAILRRESGATISDTEFATAEKQYFPQPGDDTQTLLQKKNARNTAINSFKANVPNYTERTATIEDSYLDKQAIPAVTTVTNKVDNPVSTYRMKLQGLPGTP